VVSRRPAPRVPSFTMELGLGYRGGELIRGRACRRLVLFLLSPLSASASGSVSDFLPETGLYEQVVGAGTPLRLRVVREGNVARCSWVVADGGLVAPSLLDAWGCKYTDDPGACMRVKVAVEFGLEVRDQGIFALDQKNGPELPTHPKKGTTWIPNKGNDCYLVLSIEAVGGESVSVRTMSHCDGIPDRWRETVRWERGRGPVETKSASGVTRVFRRIDGAQH
jgi:hypothetical protein